MGDVGEHVPTCQVSQGLMAAGRWEMRETHSGVVGGGGGLAKLAGLRKHRAGNQTVALTEFRHTRGLSAVSELEEETRRPGERPEEAETEGQIGTDRRPGKVTVTGGLSAEFQAFISLSHALSVIQTVFPIVHIPT